MKFHRILVRAFMVVAILALGIVALQYRGYVFAMAWHRFHSADVKFGMHEIDLPKLWWAGKTDTTGRLSILRACKSSAFPEPEIEITPASQGEVAESDSQQSLQEQAVVSERNRDPEFGWSYSTISLKSQHSVWHCIKGQQAVLGRPFSTGLTCYASQIPYSLDYQGPPEQEREAELIFASFQ